MVRKGYPNAKVVLAGEISVGKTSIRRKFMGDTFTGEYMKTIGAEVSYFENEKLNLTIFDLAGDTSFAHVRITLYAGTKAVVLVFDVTDPHTLEKIPDWVEEIRKFTPNDTPMIVVGNKVDLVDDVTTSVIHERYHEIISSFGEDYNIYPHRVYSSAKTGQNIDHMFSELSDMILESL